MSIFLVNTPHHYLNSSHKLHLYSVLLCNHHDYAMRHFKQITAQNGYALSLCHLVLALIECIPILGKIAGSIEKLAFRYFIPLSERLRHPDVVITDIMERKSLNELREVISQIGVNKRIIYRKYPIHSEYRQSLIHLAMEYRWIEGLKLITAYEGVNLNLKDSRGYTALYRAINRKLKAFYRFEVTTWHEGVQHLINAGANLIIKDSGGNTALHKAVSDSDIKSLQMLIHARADLDQQDILGRSALHKAIEHYSLQAVELLIEAGAALEIRTTDPSRFNSTALHTAAQLDRAEYLQLLINAGATLEAEDSRGYRAIHIAASSGAQKNLSVLLQAEVDINQMTRTGKTPLQLLIEEMTAKFGFINLAAARDLNPILRRPLEASIPSYIDTLAFLLQQGAKLGEVPAGFITDIQRYLPEGQTWATFLALHLRTAIWNRRKAAIPLGVLKNRDHFAPGSSARQSVRRP